MKKKVLILLSLTSIFFPIGCSPSPTPAPVKEFDDKNIIFTAPMISDEHVGYFDSKINNKENLDRVFKLYKTLQPQKYDAVLSCGDQTQNGKLEEVTDFMQVYKSNFNISETPFVFAHGNHDTYWSGCMLTTEFYDAYGEEVYQFDLDKTAAKLGNRHVKINGIHIFALQVKTFMPDFNDFTYETRKWLETEIKTAYQDTPNMPILVLCHSPALDTVYGSLTVNDSGVWGASKELKYMLQDYPNAILFSGHTHYGVNDERSIYQDKFSMVNVPSICDLALDTNEKNVTKLPNERDYSFGEFVEIDKDGNTRITRYDLRKEKEIKSAWIIPSPKDDLSHLKKYSTQYRNEHNVAPYMKENGKCVLGVDSNDKVKITMDAMLDDDMIFAYEVRFYLSEEDREKDDYVNSYKIMDDWYNYPKMKDQEIVIQTPTKMNSAYCFKVFGIDSFGLKGGVIPTIAK